MPVPRHPPITPGSTVHGLIEWDPTQASTLNILFVPDTSYGDLAVQANLQAFFDDIEQVIEQGYWHNNAYVNPARFNYYYMTADGSAAAPADPDDCLIVTWPAEVDTDGQFADLMLLLHTGSLRDCRWGRKATSEPTSFRTVVHESTHALFNIPDEYCCGGGYYVAQPVLYSSSARGHRDRKSAGLASPFSEVLPTGPVPFELVVPLSRAGSPLGVERIQIVDTVTGRVVVDTPVQR